MLAAALAWFCQQIAKCVHSISLSLSDMSLSLCVCVCVRLCVSECAAAASGVFRITAGAHGSGRIALATHTLPGEQQKGADRAPCFVSNNTIQKLI